jgi:hypothetical protein
MNMIGEYDTRIQELCQLASREQDSQKLNALVMELIRTFEKRRNGCVGTKPEIEMSHSRLRPSLRYCRGLGTARKQLFADKSQANETVG